VSVPPSLRVPPEVRPARLDTPAGPLAALVGGSTGVPVLLVPGYTGSKEDFLPILAALVNAGFRPTAIDLRGQHESGGPDDDDAYTIDALAKDVAGVLADIGEPAHLVGHSFGGLVTRRAVIDGVRPRSLTLIGSGPAALGGPRAAVVELMRPVLAEGGVAAIADASAAADRDNPKMAGIPADVIDFLHRRWLAASPVGVRVMGEELINAADEVDALAATGVRVLVVHGAADDAWSPAEQRAMAQRLGAAYAVVPDAVHSPACEAPQALLDVLLDFWTDN
jgi:pimeloyl-ACP methyl ester carboxylesterase